MSDTKKKSNDILLPVLGSLQQSTFKPQRNPEVSFLNQVNLGIKPGLPVGSQGKEKKKRKKENSSHIGARVMRINETDLHGVKSWPVRMAQLNWRKALQVLTGEEFSHRSHCGTPAGESDEGRRGNSYVWTTARQGCFIIMLSRVNLDELSPCWDFF